MMKLGTETGSLVNHIKSRGKHDVTKLTVGMGATLLSWSDRSPATVISIEGNIVAVQTDNYERVDTNGMSDMQEYEYSRNLEGSIHYFRINKNGDISSVYRNAETGRWNKISNGGVAFGYRSRYHDFSF